MDQDLADEAVYEDARARQWLALSRRGLLRASAGLGAGAALGGLTVAPARAAGPIVKPLPPELFTVFGTNAEMRWEAMRGQGYLTPIDRFFVRDHAFTPTIDARTYRLKLWGSGLRGAPAYERPVEFSYADLRAMHSESITAKIECTGNGRSFYATQQGEA